ncbi:Bacterioferritin [hydrothermal vent metagenome]|uniref:Bacterioferritin n=1 Tax=hydrothermal vent metagenome TaxID=652676 RepID=A0A3B0TFZ4_9ZZZZ
MNNERQILDYLNTGLRMELTAQTRYMLHGRLLADWGFNGLAAKMAEEAAEEQGHAMRFIDRILFLGGDPVLAMDEIVSAKSVKEMFQTDLADELEAVKFYAQAYQAATAAGDIGSQAIFGALILDEEGHADWLQTELGLMEKLGEAVYLQLQVAGGAAGA